MFKSSLSFTVMGLISSHKTAAVRRFMLPRTQINCILCMSANFLFIQLQEQTERSGYTLVPVCLIFTDGCITWLSLRQKIPNCTHMAEAWTIVEIAFEVRRLRSLRDKCIKRECFVVLLWQYFYHAFVCWLQYSHRHWLKRMKTKRLQLLKAVQMQSPLELHQHWPRQHCISFHLNSLQRYLNFFVTSRWVSYCVVFCFVAYTVCLVAMYKNRSWQVKTSVNYKSVASCKYNYYQTWKYSSQLTCVKKTWWLAYT